MSPQDAQNSDPYKVLVNQYANVIYPKSYFSAQKIKKNLITGIRGRKKLNITYQTELKFLI